MSKVWDKVLNTIGWAFIIVVAITWTLLSALSVLALPAVVIGVFIGVVVVVARWFGA